MAEARAVKVVLVIDKNTLSPFDVFQRLEAHIPLFLTAISTALAVHEPLHGASISVRIGTTLDHIECYPKLSLSCPSVEDRTSELNERLRLARDAMQDELLQLAILENWTVVRVERKFYGDEPIITVRQ